MYFCEQNLLFLQRNVLQKVLTIHDKCPKSRADANVKH